jgi:hypothetical protein
MTETLCIVDNTSALGGNKRAASKLSQIVSVMFPPVLSPDGRSKEEVDDARYRKESVHC